MKILRNLMLLLATVSLLTSCIVHEQRRGPRPHRHGYDKGYKKHKKGHGPHRRPGNYHRY